MSGHAIQRLVRQSPRKMRLVVDLIRGKDVNEAYAILKFNKKLAAKQIAKTLKSAVANAEQKALRDNERFDADELIVAKAIVKHDKFAFLVLITLHDLFPWNFLTIRLRHPFVADGTQVLRS